MARRLRIYSRDEYGRNKMIESLSATEATPIKAPGKAPGKNSESDDAVAPGFSFAAAMTALEGRAAQSLKTFGAAPQENAKTQAPASDKKNEAPQQPQTEQKPATARNAESAAQADRSANTLENAPKAPAAQPQQQQAASQPALQPAIVQGLNAATTQQTTPGATRFDAARVSSSADTQKSAAPKALRPAAQPNTHAPSQDFAKLLARRLNAGATTFELRLDPPELGRVEAHMKLDDDGKAVLALKFENQTALDLFSRDEAALRNTLMSSGFDLGGEQLAFSLAEEEQSPGLAADALSPEPSIITANRRYEPIFDAPFSNGAVDIRI